MGNKSFANLYRTPLFPTLAFLNTVTFFEMHQLQTYAAMYRLKYLFRNRFALMWWSRRAKRLLNNGFFWKGLHRWWIWKGQARGFLATPIFAKPPDRCSSDRSIVIVKDLPSSSLRYWEEGFLEKALRGYIFSSAKKHHSGCHPSAFLPLRTWKQT